MGCFTNEKGLKELFNSLIEMGIEQNDMSMITVYGKLEHLFGTVLGPLHGADLDTLGKKISHLGFEIGLARDIKNYLIDGGAVVVVACDNDQIEDIKELFQSFYATTVEVSE